MKFFSAICSRLPIAGIFAAALCQSLEASATELFITPAGAGTKDGSSWENALDQSAFSAAVNERMKAGDRLNVGGGEYRNFELVVHASGGAGKPKVIAGIDRGAGLPIFENVWNVAKPDKGKTGIRIEPGVSHLTFQSLRLRGYTFCVLAPHDEKGANRSHLVFDDVDMEQCRHGFYLSDCDDLQFTGCDLKRYTKHGFRFDQGCDRVTMRKCVADCSEGDAEWETKTEYFPFGFDVNDSGAPNTQFVFEDCVARNNMMPLQQKKYKNGDGFVIEDNTLDVTLRRCRSIRNQDGGFDLKVPDVHLADCVAVGNKRSFRVWTTGWLTNCLSAWDVTGLWNNGGPVEATRCTFHASSSAAVMGDDKATQPITLRDCIISAAPDAAEFHPKGNKPVIMESTVLSGPKQSGVNPDYIRPDPKWDGLGDAMDSKAFTDKGFSSRLVKAP